MTIDRDALDALVAGVAPPEDAHLWRALVTEPSSAAVWKRAVRDRAHLDTLAQWLPGRPWLAELAQLAARKHRTNGSPSIDLTARTRRFLADALTATLRSTRDEQPTDAAELEWGRVVALSVPIGTHIALDTTPASPPIETWYATAGGPGRLQAALWKLEPDEAPVALVAAYGGAPKPAYRDALAEASALAVLLIVERRAETAET